VVAVDGPVSVPCANWVGEDQQIADRLFTLT
jgi:hypothetical protein